MLIYSSITPTVEWTCWKEPPRRFWLAEEATRQTGVALVHCWIQQIENAQDWNSGQKFSGSLKSWRYFMLMTTFHVSVLYNLYVHFFVQSLYLDTRAMCIVLIATHVKYSTFQGFQYVSVPSLVLRTTLTWLHLRVFCLTWWLLVLSVQKQFLWFVFVTWQIVV